MSTAKINGNTITVQGLTWDRLISLMATDGGIDQFSVMKFDSGDEPVYEISYRMRQRELKLYAGLIHRYSAEQRAKNKHLEPKGSNSTDPTPPKGTPPRGGGGNTKEFVNTTAIAA